jgi:hypothetical protein
MKILLLASAAILPLTVLSAERSPQNRFGSASYGTRKLGPPADPGYFPIRTR